MREPGGKHPKERKKKLEFTFIKCQGFFFFFFFIPSVKSFMCSDDQGIIINARAARNTMTVGQNGLSEAEPSNGCDPEDNGSIVFSQHGPNDQAGGGGWHTVKSR